jgi:hypothetical protein
LGKKIPVKALSLAGICNKWRYRGEALLRNINAPIDERFNNSRKHHHLIQTIKNPVKASILAGLITKWRCRELNREALLRNINGSILEKL